jgi:hypothetical protein
MAMARLTRLACLTLPLAALAACGGAPATASAPDFVVRDTAVVVQTDAAFTRSEDFPARVESTIQAALGYWGGDWSSLSGATIVFEGRAHVECPGLGPSTGCYDGNIRLSTMDAGETLSCVEATVLVHEVGHAVIGDADHLDPRWMDFEALASRLVGLPGYGHSGPTACVPVANVWRHPPRR